MYFSSRADAGYQLAQELLVTYRYENCVVVALNDGGVVLGREIAAQLHCALALLLLETIDVPGENQNFGTLTQSGSFTYNSDFSEGEVDEYYTEFHGYLDDQKREKMDRINQLLGSSGIVNPEMLRAHNVILVADGLPNGALLDAAADFLKPLNILKLIICTPIASVQAVDVAHLTGDELHILSVTDNYIDTAHYYEKNDTFDHQTVIAILRDIVLHWQ